MGTGSHLQPPLVLVVPVQPFSQRSNVLMNEIQTNRRVENSLFWVEERVVVTAARRRIRIIIAETAELDTRQQRPRGQQLLKYSNNYNSTQDVTHT